MLQILIISLKYFPIYQKKNNFHLLGFVGECMFYLVILLFSVSSYTQEEILGLNRTSVDPVAFNQFISNTQQ